MKNNKFVSLDVSEKFRETERIRGSEAKYVRTHYTLHASPIGANHEMQIPFFQSLLMLRMSCTVRLMRVRGRHSLALPVWAGLALGFTPVVTSLVTSDPICIWSASKLDKKQWPVDIESAIQRNSIDCWQQSVRALALLPSKYGYTFREMCRTWNIGTSSKQWFCANISPNQLVYSLCLKHWNLFIIRCQICLHYIMEHKFRMKCMPNFVVLEWKYI